MAEQQRGRRINVSLIMAIGVALLAASSVDAAADEPKRVLYLTFDDGPALDSATGSLLELLESENVTATFFVVGDNVDKDPEMIRRIIDGGHALGNHSDTHRALNQMSPAQVRSELTDAQAAVDRAGGPTMTCYRPPFGATSDSVRSIGASLGMSEEFWDLDVQNHGRIDAQRYADQLMQAKDGDVILLHDGFVDGEVTVEAVRRFIEADGGEIEFRPLPGCLEGGTAPTTTAPTTTATTTTAPSTTAPSTAPSTSRDTSPQVVTGKVVIAPSCRSGPLGSIVDSGDPVHGAIFRIYCSHLGRSPDDAGRALDLLAANVERSAVMLAFSESTEFRVSTRTT